jgi:hypothetical protein
MFIPINFAGPVCLFESPTEKDGFLIMLAVATAFYALAVINHKLYTVVLRRWFNRSPSALWQRGLRIGAGVLLGIIAVGFFTGSVQTGGYCNDGVWEGFQGPLMWAAMILSLLILVVALILGLLVFYRLLFVVYSRVKKRFR